MSIMKIYDENYVNNTFIWTESQEENTGGDSLGLW